MYAWRLMCRKKDGNLFFQSSNHLMSSGSNCWTHNSLIRINSPASFRLRNSFLRLFSDECGGGMNTSQFDEHVRLGKQDQNDWLLATKSQRQESPNLTSRQIFEKEFRRRIVPWDKLTVSWENFPYYICKHSKEVLVECVISYMKHDKFATASKRRILLQSVSGMDLYKERLVKALAHDLKVPLLVLDSNVLAPYRISSWKPSKSKAVESSESKRPLKKGDRVKYIIDRSSIDTKKSGLASGQRGEVFEVNGDNVAVVFDSDDATKKKISLHWLDVKVIEHDEESQAQDAIEALNEVLHSVQPLVVYFPDPSVWFSRTVTEARREVFLNKLQEMLDDLSGPVVLICGENEEEIDSSSDEESDLSLLEQLIKGLKSTKSLEGDEILQLFTNVMSIHPPTEKDVLRTFNEQLLKDMQIVLTRSNITELQKVLEEHDLTCMDLLDVIDNHDVILNKRKAEMVVDWAKNLHLSSCIEPSVKGGRLNLPLKCIETAIVRLTSHKCLSMKPAQNIKNDSNNTFEKHFVSAVVRSGEIGIKFEDVGALEEVKQALDELVILPMRRPELFSHGNLLKPCKGILLFGPPGTGKTLIVKALATEAGTNFINITASTLASKWLGKSEKLTKALFTYANKLAPVIVFVDEIDSLLGSRNSLEHESTRNVKNEFMAAWDGLSSKENQRILIIGATNRPFDLDDAVVRRLPRRIYVDLPDAGNRVKILKILLAKENIESGFQFEKLATATNGYSGSDLKNLCLAAAYRPVQEIIDDEKCKGLRSDSKSVVVMRPLNLADFIQSMTKVAPSVAYDTSSMNKLKEWNEKFGQGGSRKTSCFGFANDTW